MSATIKLYELAGAGRVVSAHSLCWRQTINCHWRDRLLDAFGGKPAKQWDTLVEWTLNKLSKVQTMLNGAVPTLQHLIDVCAFSQLGDSTMTAITLDLHSIVDLTDEQFYSAKQSRYQIRAQSQRGDCDATNWLEDWKPNTKHTTFGKLD